MRIRSAGDGAGKSRRRELLLGIVIFIVAAFLCLLVLEGAMRVVHPMPMSCCVYDTSLGVVHPPNHHYFFTSSNEFYTDVAINSKGIRDYEYDYEKPEGTFRILVIGDSFTQGWGVELEQAYSKRLEEMLNEGAGGSNSGTRFEVINAGVPAYGTCEEWVYLAKEGVKYNPDLVILGYYLNDVRDAVKEPAASICTVGDGVLRAGQLEPSLALSIRSYLGSHSHLYTLVAHTKFALIDSKKRNTRGETIETSRFKYRPEDGEELAEAWQKTEKLLLAIKDASEGSGAELAIVLIPLKEHVDDGRFMEALELYGLGEDEVDMTYPNRRLEEFAWQNELEMLDLLPAFKEKNSGNTFYYDVDVHWRPGGHELAAEEIYSFLVSEKLVPTE